MCCLRCTRYSAQNMFETFNVPALYVVIQAGLSLRFLVRRWFQFLHQSTVFLPCFAQIHVVGYGNFVVTTRDVSSTALVTRTSCLSELTRVSFVQRQLSFFFVVATVHPVHETVFASWLQKISCVHLIPHGAELVCQIHGSTISGSSLFE